MNTLKKLKNVKDQMTALSMALLVILFSTTAYSNAPQFAEGEVLSVMAPSGLTLRVAPDKNSENLIIIPYADQVLVLPQLENTNVETIDWVTGQWIFVDYEGIEGYIFDGYLSNLNVPSFDFERCHLDMDFVYPLEAWSDINLGRFSNDTTNAGAMNRVTSIYDSGDKRISTIKGNEHKLELYLQDVRLMDAYHLLITMLDNDTTVDLFTENSKFFKDKEGDLYKVKIDVDNPVTIRQMKDNRIKISVWSYDYHCAE